MSFKAALICLFLACVPAGAKDFAATAEALVTTGPFTGAQVGVVFAEVATGKVRYARNADLPLVPASTAKLASSAAALAGLTTNYAFTTSFLTHGEIAGGKLETLVWRGDGDPSLSGRDRFATGEIFQIWAKALGELGIKEIGRLVTDNRYFEGHDTHPTWPDSEMAYWYQAKTSAISFNDNCVDLEFVPTKPGKRPEILLTPHTTYVQINNKAVTGKPGSRNTLDFYRVPGTNKVTLTGSIPAGRTRRDYVSVHDPARFSATVFTDTLRRRGIKVGKILPWEKAKPEEAALKQVYVWRSEPLGVLVRAVNTNSQNFYAEQILKALGKQVSGKATFDAGIARVNDYLAGIGLSTAAYSLVDGSGLSKDNRLTAAALVKLLVHMKSKPYFEVYHDSLAPAKNRMKADPELAAGMRLKRGTVGPARNLAGYLRSKSGKLYAFAVLVNGEKLDRPAVDDGIDELCIAAARAFP